MNTKKGEGRNGLDMKENTNYWWYIWIIKFWTIKKEVLVVLNDSSRKIFAGGKFDNATQENSVNLLNKMIEEYGGIIMLREVLTNRGT